MVSSQRPLGFMITKVWAKNFRSIADASLDLDSITVLVGPNASGKSNVLDILRFVKDALRFDLEAAVSMRHGFEAILRRTSGTQPNEIEIGISANTGGFPRRLGRLQIDYGFTLAAEPDGGYKVRREYATVHPNGNDYHEPIVFSVEDGRMTSPESLSPYNGPGTLSRQEEDDATAFDATDLSLRRIVRSWSYGRAPNSPGDDESMGTVARAVEIILRRISSTRFYHLFPNTMREPQKIGNPHPLDEDAANLASVLRNLEREQGGTIDRVKRSLSRLVPGVCDLEVTSVGGYLVVRLKHEDVQDGGWLDLSQESDGTIRLLGLLTCLHQGRSLPLIGIEEPELTVHPGALTALADLLREASRRCQLIVTTHSPELIDRVTDFRDVELLRVVEIVNGVTQISLVSGAQKESVKRHLFSPGELHRMGDLERSGATQ